MKLLRTRNSSTELHLGHLFFLFLMIGALPVIAIAIFAD